MVIDWKELGARSANFLQALVRMILSFYQVVKGNVRSIHDFSRVYRPSNRFDILLEFKPSDASLHPQTP